MKFQFNGVSLENQETIINKIIELLENNNIIVFEGTLGSGKTTLIKGLCQFMGVTDQVNSPTYGLVNEYHSKSNKIIYHFDFYRILSLEEAFDMGVEEYLYSNNLCLIEWATHIQEILPEHYLKVSINYNHNKRDYTLEKI
jgi:tRNA threonylcarbamoyladenosine biosynthesis protein TsaE